MENKKKKRLLFLVIAAGIVGWFLLMRPAVFFTDNRPVLEKGETYATMDFVKQASGELSVEAEYFDTSTIGEYEMTYTITRGGITRQEVLHYSVVDTTPPHITILSPVVSIDPDEEYDENRMRENVTVDEGTLTFLSDIDTRYAGIYTVTINAIDEAENTSSASYALVVRDLIPPFVFADADGLRLKKGAYFDLDDYLSYGDNADPEPMLEVEGEIDTNKLGKQTLHAVLTDHSGNQTKWDMTIQILNKITYDDDEMEKYPFAEFVKDYVGKDRKLGIDVSEWQGDIDFDQIKKAGCEFIMMRIGYSYQGKLTLDKSFRDNLAGAKEAGLPVGIYFYCHDRSEEEIMATMDQIFAELDGTQLELPIVFDWENFQEFQEYRISFQDLNRLYDVFAGICEEHGYQSMLYGSKYYLETIWTDTDTRPVWLAHYVDKTSYKQPFRLWQMWAWGQIEGIEGDVDLDILFTENS